MTSRFESLNPIREWTAVNGEEWVALHPVYAALSEEWLPKGVRGAMKMKMLPRLLREIVRGERHLPDALASRMLGIDAKQRANGYPDENLGNLITLLKESEFRYVTRLFALYGVKLPDKPEFACEDCGDEYDVSGIAASAEFVPFIPDGPGALEAKFSPVRHLPDMALVILTAFEEEGYRLHVSCGRCQDRGMHRDGKLAYSESEVAERQAIRLKAMLSWIG